MNKIVYKVVCRTKAGQLISYNVNGFILSSSTVLEDTEKRLTYAIGMTTTPRIKGSKLFAFHDLAEALRRVIGDAEVYEAEATNVKRLHDFNPLGGDIVGYWKAKRSKKKMKPFGNGMKGSVVADSIRLLRKIS